MAFNHFRAFSSGQRNVRHRRRDGEHVDGGQQINPAVAALADGNVVFVWSSRADGSLQGVYGSASPTGENWTSSSESTKRRS
jgi:hypothetical protein